MIYLIGFPGFGTDNIYETEIYNKVMSICNSFFFIVRNLIIKENKNAIILNTLFKNTMDHTDIISSNRFIKSCFFIINNDIKQYITENELKDGKQQIKQTINNKIEDINIKLSFFNAQYYSNYYNSLYYFYNVTDLFDMEHKNLTKYCNNIFLNPESF